MKGPASIRSPQTPAFFYAVHALEMTQMGYEKYDLCIPNSDFEKLAEGPAGTAVSDALHSLGLVDTQAALWGLRFSSSLC